MVVDEREQVGLAAGDDRAVQRITGPPLVRGGGLEPAERPRRPPVGAGVELEADEVALQGPLRRGGAGRGEQDRADLRRRARRHLPLQRGRQLQHRRRGAWLGRAGRGQQRVEPAAAPDQDPAIDRDPRDPDPLPERAGVLPGREVADQPAALARGQRRVRRGANEGVAEQPHLTGPVSASVPALFAAVVLPCSAGHRASNSS